MYYQPSNRETCGHLLSLLVSFHWGAWILYPLFPVIVPWLSRTEYDGRRAPFLFMDWSLLCSLNLYGPKLTCLHVASLQSTLILLIQCIRYSEPSLVRMTSKTMTSAWPTPTTPTFPMSALCGRLPTSCRKRSARPAHSTFLSRLHPVIGPLLSTSSAALSARSRQRSAPGTTIPYVLS